MSDAAFSSSHSSPALPTDDASDDTRLREFLKHASPDVAKAAREFRATRDPKHVPAVLHALLAHHVPTDLADRLNDGREDLQLREHLGLDSLTLTEMSLEAEDVFDVSLASEDLRSLTTVEDLRALIVRKSRH